MLNVNKNLFLNQAENITAVTSGMESCGKTWFAISLAYALNMLKNNVLLFDADNGVSNIAFQLNIQNEYFFDDALKNKCCLNQTIYSNNRRNLDLITARSGSELIDNVAVGRLQLIGEDFSIIAKNYDYVITDTLPSEKILYNFLPNYKNLLLICNNEPANLVATYQFLQSAVKKNKFQNLKIVVNYANTLEEGMQTYNTLQHVCEQFIKIRPELLGIVRNDSRVRDAIRNHVPLFSRYPNCEAAQDVMDIARNLINEEKNGKTV